MTIKHAMMAVLVFASAQAHAIDMHQLNFKLSLKQPGNRAVTMPLTQKGGNLYAETPLPLTIKTELVNEGKDVKYTIGSSSVTVANGAGKVISLADSRGSYTASDSAIVLGSDFTGTMDAGK